MGTASRPAPASADPEATAVAADASIGALVHQLFDDSGQLVRAELRLAHAEIGASFRSALAPIAAIAIGGVFLTASMLTLLAALIGWLTPQLGAGNAALVVTIAAIAIGGAFIGFGVVRMKGVHFTPRRLARTLREDVAALPPTHPESR